MIVVSNSTPLMHLSAMGQPELLRTLFTEVHVPDEVYEEVVVQGAGMPGADEVAAAGWIKRHQVDNSLAVLAMSGDLHLGEAACIVLATELGADLTILDDGAARLKAEAQGLRITGTVGVPLAADARGLVSFPEALSNLLATEFHLHPKERERVLDLWRSRQSKA